MSLTMITILQLIIMIVYIGYISKRFGVLPSISDSTYKLERNKKSYFLAFCWLLGLTNLFQDMGVIGYYASVGLFFTGVTINHKSFAAFTRPLHLIGAITAITLSSIGLWILYDIWWVTIGVALSIPLLWKSPNRIWWIEIISFALIIMAYFIKALN